MGLWNNVLTKRIDLGHVRVATSYFDRLIGLMGKRDLRGIKILFPNCHSVHTCFMLVAIDLVFVDKSRRVVKVLEDVKPWRFVSGGPESHAVVEMQNGSISAFRVEEGDLVEWR